MIDIEHKIENVLSRSLKEFSGSGVNPALVIGVNVTPSVLELVAEGPKEVTLDHIIHSRDSALTNNLDVSIIIDGRISGAFAFFNNRALVGTERTEFSNSSVEISTSGFRHVGEGAVNHLAFVYQVRVVVVESTEPHSAGIKSKRPLTNPDIVLDIIGGAETVVIVITVSLSGSLVKTPSLIEVVIHNNLVVIIISKHAVPASAVVEGIVENESNLRSLLLDHCSNILVELNQGVSGGVPPWFIDGLECVESWVRTPSIEKLTNVI